MRTRKVIPEILDSLDAADSEAIRSRRDLRLINALMGNYRWLRSRLLDGAAAVEQWYETGSGDGPLAALFSTGEQGDLSVTGVDFAPRPASWPRDWDWLQGDLFESLDPGSETSTRSEGLVANLFLHHFEAEALQKIGAIANARFSHLLVSEPARFRVFSLLGYILFPFVNRVTRHDMQVSIRAGFRKGELAKALQLDGDWEIRESVHPLGAYRFEAWRK